MDEVRKTNKKVAVAMSGGIDSSVAAALLKRDGFLPVGVFLKLWPSFNEKRARQVAEKIGIPFYIFNFEKEFKKKVVDYFLKESKAGLTPNPCVVCNKEIKFGLLFKKALSLKTDCLATGHYVRKKGNKLLKAKDKGKDQSYFLWKLNQKTLGKTLFPVGDYTKEEVRRLAKKFKLPLLNIPESQEICFVQTSIRDFLNRHLKPKPGKIIDSEGKVVGEHKGLWFYTIGQRRGLKLPSAKPFYVLDKEVKKNILIVTQNEKELYKKELIVKEVNWISTKPQKFPLKVKAKIRYRHKSAPAVLSYQLKNKSYKLIFNKAQRAITPGQSVVFYLPCRQAGQGEELLGGGIMV